MKIAVMQPYFFPYLGYFQLIYSSDIFIFYDDVNFIKRGWINRNKIKVNDASNLFSVPLNQVSQNVVISKTSINQEEFLKWKTKFLKTLQQNYSKAPYFETVFGLIKRVLNSNNISIADLAEKSIHEILQYLGLNKKIFKSSELPIDNKLNGQDRIISICKELDATQYLNLSGGKVLYDRHLFNKNGVDLKFITTKEIFYNQLGNEFISNLSIIDVLMNNSKNEIFELLTASVIE